MTILNTSINRHLKAVFILSLLSAFFIGDKTIANQTDNQTSAPIEKQLIRCPDKPNCINTEYPDDTSHYLPPMDFPDSSKNQIMTMAKKIIQKMGGEIIKEDNNHLSATFTSSLFRFVDDFEIRQDNATHKLQIRSSSRTGYSDFGVNKRRVKKFTENLKKQLTTTH